MSAELNRRAIWVFGSNMAGRHGAGAALVGAQEYGAKHGVGLGRTGNAYAIPTLDARFQRLPFEVVAEHIAHFLVYAHEHPDDVFLVTRVGCGLAGFDVHDSQAGFVRPERAVLHREEVLRVFDQWSARTEEPKR